MPLGIPIGLPVALNALLSQRTCLAVLCVPEPASAHTQGNLCWEAALEVSLAAKSVHALVMDPEGKILDAE